MRITIYAPKPRPLYGTRSRWYDRVYDIRLRALAFDHPAAEATWTSARARLLAANARRDAERPEEREYQYVRATNRGAYRNRRRK